jgi:hypothetical protein
MGHRSLRARAMGGSSSPSSMTTLAEGASVSAASPRMLPTRPEVAFHLGPTRPRDGEHAAVAFHPRHVDPNAFAIQLTGRSINQPSKGSWNAFRRL